MQMQVQGMQAVQNIMNVVSAKVSSTKSSVVQDLGRKAVPVAKERTPRDTGALQASIHLTTLTDTPVTTTVEVVAGSPDISRGVGAYTYNRSGVQVDAKPTSEYAAEVELGIGKYPSKQKGFMINTADWVRSHVEKDFIDALRKVLG